MRKLRRFVAFSAVILFIVSLSLLPVAAAVIQSSHSCCGMSCLVCRAIDTITGHKLSCIYPSVPLFLFASLLLLSFFLYRIVEADIIKDDPVSLKTKISC